MVGGEMVGREGVLGRWLGATGKFGIESWMQWELGDRMRGGKVGGRDTAGGENVGRVDRGGREGDEEDRSN